MTTEEKFMAIKALDDRASLYMRKPGDWYVEADIYISDGQIQSSTGPTSTDPWGAIEAVWKEITEIPATSHIVGRDVRVRWVGYMWAPWKHGQPVDTSGASAA